MCSAHQPEHGADSAEGLRKAATPLQRFYQQRDIEAERSDKGYCVHDELPGDCAVCREVGDMMPEAER